MGRKRSGSVAIVLGAFLIMAMGTPAAAATIVGSHGSYGGFGFLPAEDEENPAGRCGYSDVKPDGWAHLEWMRVIGPWATARDNTAGRDKQRVSWVLKIQRPSGKTVAKSTVQSMTAYDDQPADFTAKKVSFNARADREYRAVAEIKWWRNGSIEGWVWLRADIYSVKWTVGSPDYLFQFACTGVAD